MPNNYEILILTDPKEEKSVIDKLANDTFKQGIEKIEQLERTELAYKINGSLTAHYFLINVKTEGDLIKEFTRRSNIMKTIWRIMVINLDTERGLNRKASSRKRFMKKSASERSFTPRPRKEESVEGKTFEGKKPYPYKKPFKKEGMDNKPVYDGLKKPYIKKPLEVSKEKNDENK